MAKKLDATPLYRRLITDAWHLAWEHKHLWLFGFFATFIGFGGVSEVLFSAFDKSSSFLPVAGEDASLLYFIPGLTTIRALIQFSPSPLISVTLFTSVMALMIGIFAWIVTVSIGALVGSVKKIAAGSDARFPEGMRMGSERLWPVFGINVLSKAVIAGGLFLTSANMLFSSGSDSTVSALIYMVSFVVFTALAIVVTIIAIYATNYAVIKGQRAMEAIDNAWRMLSTHWLISIEMTIVLFVASFVIGVAAVVVGLVTSVPLIFLILLSVSLGAKGAGLVIGTIALGMALIAVGLLASMITTFQVAAWTMLWEELAGKKRTARLLHLAHSLKKRFSSH